MGDETRAADAVVSALEHQIVSGALKDNSPLPAERMLMDQFGTSRTVIREAISMLAGRGMVESRPRFRPIVRKPDYGTVLDATGNIVSHLLNEAGGIENMYRSRMFVERGGWCDRRRNWRQRKILPRFNRLCWTIRARLLIPTGSTTPMSLFTEFCIGCRKTRYFLRCTEDILHGWHHNGSR